jgi:hypothetical protein
MRLWVGRSPGEFCASGAANRGPAASSIGNSRFSSRTSGTGQGALAVGVKGADRVDLVVEQVHRKGTSEPMNKSISPRTAYSPG